MTKTSLKEIKKNSLRIIKENKNEEFFKEDIISLSQNKIFDDAKNKLEMLAKNWENSYIDFLEALTYYISNLSKKENLTYNKESKKDIKKIEINFNDTYLLIAKDSNLNEFVTQENIQVLSILDELTQILNHFEYNKEADILFMLKGKIELGVQRYLYYSKEEVLLKRFTKKGDFEKLDKFEQLNIFNTFLFDAKEYKKLINKLGGKMPSQNIMKNILNCLAGLKTIDEKKYDLELKKYIIYLNEFPEKILSKKEFEELKRIEESLSPEKNLNFIKKNEKYLLDLNSVEIANIIIQKL
jgi:hypothetical protein